MHVVALIENEGGLASDMRLAAGELGLGLTTVRWSELSALAGGDADQVRAGDVVLNDCDVVVLRTMRAGTFEQIFFRMDVLHRLEAAGMTVVNRPLAIEVSVDKYRSLATLHQAGLTTPRTFVCQKYTDSMAAFDALGRDVVLKPLFGSQGFGVTRISDRVMAQRAFSQLERMGQVAYVQQFIAHGQTDLRLLVVGDAVMASMRRYGVDWRTNIALGGEGQAVDADAESVDMALRAARACGALVAGVDILNGEDGRRYVLEVNAIPGWRKLADVTGLDITRRVLAHVAEHAQKRQAHV